MAKLNLTPLQIVYDKMYVGRMFKYKVHDKKYIITSVDLCPVFENSWIYFQGFNPFITVFSENIIQFNRYIFSGDIQWVS